VQAVNEGDIILVLSLELLRRHASLGRNRIGSRVARHCLYTALAFCRHHVVDVLISAVDARRAFGYHPVVVPAISALLRRKLLDGDILLGQIVQH
jgi:hypothetical protein